MITHAQDHRDRRKENARLDYQCALDNSDIASPLALRKELEAGPKTV